MKKFIFILSLLSLLIATQAFASHRLATFNIRCTPPADTVGRDWGVRGPYCAKVIKDYKFDVVGLQEITDEGVKYRNPVTGRTQLADLKSWLPDYEILVWDRDGAQRKEYVGVAFRKDRYWEIERGHFFISATPDKYSKGWDPKVRKHPRVVGWVRLRDKKSGEEFVFASSHTNNGWSLDGPYGSELVSRKMMDIAGNSPVMIVADFNTTRTDIDRKGLKAYLATFHDAALEAPEKKNCSLPKSNPNIDWTYNGFSPASDTASRGREIDFMFYRGMNIKERHILTDEFKYKNKRYPVSDHFPIYVDADLAPRLPKTLYVNGASNAEEEGTQSAPFQTVSAAVAAAEIGDTLKVTAGIYEESVAPHCSITLIGGYDASFESVSGRSVLDGAGLTLPPVYLPGYYSLSIKNIEIKDYISHSAELDGAIHFNGTDLTLENVVVRNCKAQSFGGGLSIYNHENPGYCDCNNLTLLNCNFIGNEAPCGGGIAAGAYGKLSISDCSFISNVSTSAGAGAYLMFGKPEKGKISFTRATVNIEHCRFVKNSAETCSAVYISDNMPGVKLNVVDTEF